MAVFVVVAAVQAFDVLPRFFQVDVAAQRALEAVREPDVHALHVVPVAAGQDPDPLPPLEVLQADEAVAGQGRPRAATAAARAPQARCVQLFSLLLSLELLRLQALLQSQHHRRQEEDARASRSQAPVCCRAEMASEHQHLSCSSLIAVHAGRGAQSVDHEGDQERGGRRGKHPPQRPGQAPHQWPRQLRGRPTRGQALAAGRADAGLQQPG
mmetsp:Transcript_39861/g.114846  ORF Transcript_39861/g.114846 Transcript_39861/m.114846 type:complete len:212 (+) Transcript_39861:483-1118(+)